MQKTNIVVIGHIDHGKSTLMGRLLYDSGSLPEEKIEEVKKTAEKLGKNMEFAFFIDSLEEEREDAMTIDIMHIPLKINEKEYLLIDCPGHKELIKNMLSGESVNVIARKVGVSKSTASLWVRDVILTIEQLESLRQNSIKGSERGRLKGAFLQKQRRILAQEKYQKGGDKRNWQLVE